MTTLALNILDIVQNSVRAKASMVKISIDESFTNDRMTITITDNGTGMSKEMLDKATDPFTTSRTTRRVGLGLPLLKLHANLAKGDISINSQEGKGTVVKAWFSLTHVDRQPLGDIAGVLTILVGANPKMDFLYKHSTDKGKYSFSTRQTKRYLDVKDLSEPSLLGGIKEMINENLKEIKTFDTLNN